MNANLVRLFFRRVLSRTRLALVLAALGLFAYVSPPAAWLIRVSDDPERARHAFALQTIWSGCLWLLIPLVLVHAAQLPTLWRTTERGWIASRPGARAKVLWSSWFGTWIGAAVLTAVVFVGAELGASPSPEGTTWAFAGEQAGPPRGLVPPTGVRWSLQSDARLTRARVELALAPGVAPTATARLRATRNGLETSTETQLLARGRIELELPPGDGPVECELTPVGEGARLLVRKPTTELFVPAGSRFGTSLSISLHVLLTLGATIALALGLGSHLGTGYAFALLASVWLGFWLQASGSTWVPGSALPEILAELHEGRVPARPQGSAWLGALGTAVFGASLAWLRVRMDRGVS